MQPDKSWHGLGGPEQPTLKSEVAAGATGAGKTQAMSPWDVVSTQAASAGPSAGAGGAVPPSAPRSVGARGLVPPPPRRPWFRKALRRLAKITLAGAVVAGAGGVVWAKAHPGALFADDSDDPGEQPTAGSARAHKSRERSTLGWIPEDAREATPRSALRADRGSDPLCAAEDSPIEVGKAFAVKFERELRESTKMSDEEESRIGKRLVAAAAREREFAGRWDRPEDVDRYGAYLNGLVQHLARGTTRKGISYRVHVVRDPEFNAAALPGGSLLVFTGVLEGREAVRTEAELVAVLSHEMSHVERRHTIAAYQYARATLGADADEGVMAMKIITTPIASEYELEADDRGLELAVMAQYDPQAAVDLWRRRARTERAEPRGPFGGLVDDVLRSHPHAAVRACHAMDRVAWARTSSPWDRLYDGKTNLKARVMGPKHAY